MLSQDLLGISDSLTSVHTSYETLENLLLSSRSGIALNVDGFAVLLGLINNQLQTIIDGVEAARIAS
jgi:hypothetical protein